MYTIEFRDSDLLTEFFHFRKALGQNFSYFCIQSDVSGAEISVWVHAALSVEAVRAKHDVRFRDRLQNRCWVHDRRLSPQMLYMGRVDPQVHSSIRVRGQQWIGKCRYEAVVTVDCPRVYGAVCHET